MYELLSVALIIRIVHGYKCCLEKKSIKTVTMMKRKNFLGHLNNFGWNSAPYHTRRVLDMKMMSLLHDLLLKVEKGLTTFYKWKRIPTYSHTHTHSGNTITDEFDDDEKILKTT